MCYKTTAQMKYDWHCNNFNSIDKVIIAVLIIHPNNEHSAWIFLNNFWIKYEMLKICFLIVVSIIHALNILLECIEWKHVFQNRRTISDCFV